MKLFTRLTLLLLCLATLLSCVAILGSCTGQGEKKTEVDDNPTEGTGDVPNVPDTKYNKDFVIMTQDKSEFYVDEPSSDIVQDAIYRRNLAVEQKYGITIKPKEEIYYNIPDKVGNLVKASDYNNLNLILEHLIYGSNIVIQGNALNWYDVPYVDFTKSYWPATNVDSLTVNDRCFIAEGDLSITSVSHTLCFFFNKDLVDQYQLGDIYDIVDKQKWTYSTMYDMIKDIRKDLNNDGKYKAQDLYGFVFNAFTSICVMIWGFDNPVFSYDENTGDPVCTFYSPKITKIMNNLLKFFYRTDGVYYRPDGTPGDLFTTNQAVFTNGWLDVTVGALRDMEGWGLIPMPKYDSKQKDYVTMVGGGSQALLMPKIGGTPESVLEMNGAMTDVLVYLSNRDVMPTYYNKALKGKYADSPKEAAMIDRLVARRLVDFGYIYMGFVGPAITCQELLTTKSADIASAWAKNKGTYEDVLEDVYEQFGLTFEGLD